MQDGGRATGATLVKRRMRPKPVILWIGPKSSVESEIGCWLVAWFAGQLQLRYLQFVRKTGRKPRGVRLVER